MVRLGSGQTEKESQETSGWKCEKKKKINQQEKKEEWGLDIQNVITKLPFEFHPPGYQYLGPGTRLKIRLKRGDLGKNRLDRIAKQHDIDYGKAKTLQDKWKADAKMIKSIDKLSDKTFMEKVIKKMMQIKKRLKLLKNVQSC